MRFELEEKTISYLAIIKITHLEMKTKYAILRSQVSTFSNNGMKI